MSSSTLNLPRMRVLYDHQRFCTQEYGGVTRYFCELALAMYHLLDGQVEVFSPLYVNRYLHDTPEIRPRGLLLPRLPYSGAPIKLLNSLAARLALPRRSDVHIFHETYYSRHDCAPKGARRIVTVFDMIHERMPEFFSTLDYTRRAKRLAVHRADHVICISENTRSDLVDILKVPAEKTTVIHLGYSKPRRSSGAAFQPICAPYLLFVGGRAGYKNFSRLLNAFLLSRLPRAGYSLVCFGGGPFTADENAQISGTGMRRHHQVVQLSGDDNLLTALYAQAAALVYPSLYEGFGLPPLEAMAQGCPVICSRSSSLPEVVGDAAEFFDPSSESSIQSALENVALNAVRASELAAGGRRRANAFSWDKCASETLAVYRQTLGA